MCEAESEKLLLLPLPFMQICLNKIKFVCKVFPRPFRKRWLFCVLLQHDSRQEGNSQGFVMRCAMFEQKQNNSNNSKLMYINMNLRKKIKKWEAEEAPTAAATTAATAAERKQQRKRKRDYFVVLYILSMYFSLASSESTMCFAVYSQ